MPVNAKKKPQSKAAAKATSKKKALAVVPLAPPKLSPRPERNYQYRNPSTRHIPDDLFVPRMAHGFPWRPVSNRVVIMHVSPEERVTSSGIIIPAYEGARGADRENTTGIVLAMGPGAVIYGNFDSPEHDHDVQVGDIVFIEPNCGVAITDHELTYRVVRPEDLIMIGRRDKDQSTRKDLMDAARDAMSRYEKKSEGVFRGAGARHIPRSQDKLEEKGRLATETLREMRAKPRRSQFLFSDGVSQKDSMIRKE